MTNSDRPEIEMLDVLKTRVAEGKPIYVTGRPSQAVMTAVVANAQQAAAEAGMSARVVQVVELPALARQPQGPFTVERESEPGCWVGMASNDNLKQAQELVHDSHRRVVDATGAVVYPLSNS